MGESLGCLLLRRVIHAHEFLSPIQWNSLLVFLLCIYRSPSLWDESDQESSPIREFLIDNQYQEVIIPKAFFRNKSLAFELLDILLARMKGGSREGENLFLFLWFHRQIHSVVQEYLEDTREYSNVMVHAKSRIQLCENQFSAILLFFGTTISQSLDSRPDYTGNYVIWKDSAFLEILSHTFQRLYEYTRDQVILQVSLNQCCL